MQLPIPFLVLAFIVLGGLAFILLVGRRRHTSQGIVNHPAPGSGESPLFDEPERRPQNTRTQRRGQ